MTIEIWHNPRCSKSRETLSLIEEKGIKPTLYLYLEEKPDAKLVAKIIKKLGVTARDLLRTSEDAYKEQGLKDLSLSEGQLIDAMVSEPKLIQRPIVINGDRAKLGRPPEDVLEIL